MYQPPFTISDEMLTLVAEISERIGGLNVMMTNQMPHPMLRKENRIKTIQSSLAIENNTLNIEQVTAIMEGKRVLGPLNEIQEVKGTIAANGFAGTLATDFCMDSYRVDGKGTSAGILRCYCLQ